MLNSFELWFQFKRNPYQEVGELGKSWGRFGFRMNGRELFHHKESKEVGIEWNMIYLKDWLTERLFEKYIPDPVQAVDWIGGLDFAKELDRRIEENEDLELEDLLMNQVTWINSKNLWNVGQGIQTPSVFFVIDEVKGLVDISWEQQENDERSFELLPSNRVFVKIEDFRTQIDAFLNAYHDTVLPEK